MPCLPVCDLRRIAFWPLTLLIACSFCGVLVTPQAHGASVRDPAGVKQERDDVRKQLQEIKKAITQTSGEKQRVSRAIDVLDKKLDETQGTLGRLDRDRKFLEKDIRGLREQENTLADKLVDTQNRLAHVIRNQYRRIDINPTQAWLAGRSASQAARESYWYEQVSEAEQALGQQQARQALELQAIRTGLENKREALKVTIADQNTKERELQSQREERKQLVADLNSKLKDQELQKDRLQRDEKRLTGVIEQLSRAIEQAKRKQALERQSQASRPKSGADNKKTASPPPPIPDNGDFAKLKGRLQLPVSGRVIGEFGKTRSKDGQGPSWKGIFIESAAGIPVKAIGSGRVVFSEWLRGFGEIVIIDHGDQFLSVYGNNGKLLKTAGDVVKAGETVAETGNSSGNLETGLYFELRHQGQPFNPISWTKGQ